MIPTNQGPDGESRTDIPVVEAERALGIALRQRRTNAGLSQAALARLLHVHHTTISHIERGSYNVQPPLLEALVVLPELGLDECERQHLRQLYQATPAGGATALPTDQAATHKPRTTVIPAAEKPAPPPPPPAGGHAPGYTACGRIPPAPLARLNDLLRRA
jgi:transcriptional regulator with XRE-family HTH domain